MTCIVVGTWNTESKVTTNDLLESTWEEAMRNSQCEVWHSTHPITICFGFLYILPKFLHVQTNDYISPHIYTKQTHTDRQTQIDTYTGA